MDRRENDYAPISGLQHFLFCERQCALIHVERQWDDNELTVEGTALHARTDSGETERRGNVRILRHVFLRSDRLRLIGYSDVVEEHGNRKHGQLRYIPVEFKHGTGQGRFADDVQLCAQGMALEEMLGVIIDVGAITYLGSRRRREVSLTPDLRASTIETAERFHAMILSETIPTVQREEPRCRSCSLREICCPKETARMSAAHAQRYLDALLESE